MNGQRDSQQAMQMRLEEDREALEDSGIKKVYLQTYFDKQYRSTPYSTAEIAHGISKVVREESTIYAPVAIGSYVRRHSDHILVQRAAHQLLENGRDVAFYADVPYMLPVLGLADWAERAPIKRIEKILDLDLEPEIVDLNPAQQERKWEAVHKYKSQFKMVNMLALGALSRAATYRQELVLRPV